MEAHELTPISYIAHLLFLRDHPDTAALNWCLLDEMTRKEYSHLAIRTVGTWRDLELQAQLRALTQR